MMKGEMNFMKHIEELESLTLCRERLFLPFDANHKTKGCMIYSINNTRESLVNIFEDRHLKISNTGNFYKTYYYDYRVLPKSIKSKRVKNSGLTVASAKSDRLANYAFIQNLCPDVKTPLVLKSPGYNFIYDLNPLTELMEKQDKLKLAPIREFITMYFDTLNAIVGQSIPGYNNKGIFIDLDEYKKVNPKYHLLTQILLLLKRPDKFIETIKSEIKVVFYTNQGCFLVDLSKDLTRENYQIINRLVKKLKPELSPENDVNVYEKEEVQRYLAAKATSMHFDGEEDAILPDDIIDADSEIVDKVSDEIDSVDDLEDDEKVAELDKKLDEDELLQQEFQDAIAQTSTGKKKSEASLKRDAMLREKQKSIKVKSKTFDQINKSKAVVKLQTHRVELDTVTNENMKNVKFPEFNKTYMENTYEHDIASTIEAISQDKSIPVYITNIEVADTSDEFTVKETYTVTIEDENRKRHTLKFALPKVVDNEFIIVNGNKKTIQNQFMLYPVIKTGPDTVQICTNYNKIFMYRIGNKFSASSEKYRKLMENYPAKFTIQKGCNTSINSKYLTSLEYDEFAKTYNTIKVGKVTFDFNQQRLHEKFPNYKDEMNKYLIGYDGNKPIIYDSKSGDYADLIGFMVSFSNDEQMIADYKSYSSGKKFTYTIATIMAKDIPVIVVISYFEGLTTVIRKFNALNGDLVKFTDKQANKENMNYIHFSDGFIEYPKSNMEACMLFNGLSAFGTREYSISDMDNRTSYVDIFNTLFRGNGGYGVADALLNYYDWMIDPITLEILQMLNYPEDIVSLMIFANNLLADSHYTSDMDINMYRVRSMEVISAILYKNIARSYSRYRRTANNPNPAKITMDENAVIKELVALPTVEDYSELSPMVEVHKQGLISMKGANGMNLDMAYKLDKRAYHDSMVGMIGISTDPGLNK